MERCGSIIIPVEKDDYMFLEPDCFGFGLGRLMLENHFSDEPWDATEYLLLACRRDRCMNCERLDACIDYIFDAI